MSGDLTMRPLDIDRDAEALAAMWNSSLVDWPGNEDALPWTAQRARESVEREQALEMQVWDAGDAIAGLCTFREQLDEPGVTYVGVLNVMPAYQKLGLGRRFLTYFVGRSLERGAKRLDLHTWSGNLKAVPLYKKCGFFWMPGTGVHMFNLLPSILAMPAAKPFFARHDWYASLRRELSQSEDDERWEGMKVFTYRFEAGDEHLTVRADQQARAITAIETDAFGAAAIAADSEPPRGTATALRWRLANKGARPIAVSLIASGTADLTLDHREAFQLVPGETRELEAPVQVGAAAEAKEGKPAPALRTLLVIDGQLVELATGLAPKPAVEISTEPAQITLAPGVPIAIEVQLRSRLKAETTATVSAAPADGLTADWSQREVQLAADGRAGLTLTLRADRGGVYELPISVRCERQAGAIELPAPPRPVFVLPPGGVLGAAGRDELRIENERLRLVMRREGAVLSFSERATGRWLCEEGGNPVPPHYPNEFEEAAFDLRLERDGEAFIAVASHASKELPGLVLHKRVRVGAGPVVQVGYEFDNQGPHALRLQLVQWLWGDQDSAQLTLPLRGGLVRGPWSEFPGEAADAFKRADTYGERWAAREHGIITLGLIWGDDVEKFEWGGALTTRFYDCPPQQRVCPQPLYIYAGDGDWRSVRRLAQRLADQPAPQWNERPTHPVSALHARLDPPVVVAANDRAEAELVVEWAMSRKLDFTAQLDLPDGWQADVTAAELKQVFWQQPARTPLRLTATGKPGVSHARLSLRSSDEDATFELPLLRLGDGGAVDVRKHEHAGQRVLTISNGLLELDVTPGFGGTLSALRLGGVNQLVTPFPVAATFDWMSPWYGGATPILIAPGERPFPGKLHRERFEAEPVVVEDNHGLTWKGVRQRAELAGERLRGLVLEIDTLTLGGSPLVRQVLRLHNATSATRRLAEAGWLIFVQPGGARERTVLHTPERRIKRRARMPWMYAGHWAAAENPDTGHTLALVSPVPQVNLAGFNLAGGHLKLLPGIVVPPHGSAELVAYLALADTLEAARRYVALKDL